MENKKTDWLHLDYFAKLDKNRNPHGAVCILCTKTHFIKDCPYKKDKPKPKREETFYSSYEELDNDDGSYGY